MAQGTTTTTQLDDTLIAQYLADFYSEVEAGQVWNQFAQLKGDPGGKGTTVTMFFVPPFDYISTAIDQSADVVPIQFGDASVSITMQEYANAGQLSAMARQGSYIGGYEQAGRNVLADNFLDSWERLCRTQFIAGSAVYRVGGLALRTSLDATSDLITWKYLTQLVSMARSRGIPPFPDGSYASVIPYELEGEVMNLGEWEAVAEYSDPSLIWDGVMSNYGGRSFRNERGRVCGIRFCVSRRGKLYLSGGTTAQAATTLDGAAAAGDTDIDVASATGIAAGNFITVGTLESAVAEQVQVTAVATNNLTILGAGDPWTGPTNLGLRYAHADGVAVTEAANVAAIPIIGPMSLGQVYSELTGRYSDVRVGFAEGAVIPERFLNFAWWWIGGYGILSERWIMRGECAVESGHFGPN